MARTPSMTTQEAESLLGPRGNLRVNAENKPIVRKWLSAQGFPALFSGALSYIEMANAYNKTDGSGIAAIRRKLDAVNEAGEDAGDAVLNDVADLLDLPKDAPVAAPSPAKPVPAVIPPANAHDATAIGILRDLLLNGYQPGINADQVRSIVQEQMAGIAPRIIEVRHPGKDAIKIEGLTHPDFERALGYLNHGANIMLVGPAGCGKTHLIAQLATALDVSHTIVGGTAGATEGDLIGKLLPVDGGAFHYFPSEFVKLYEAGNSLLAFDEIDGFDPNMLMVANMPLANGHMYVHLRSVDKLNPRIKRGERVHFMATANTFGTGANPIYAGRNPMDEATRDRFIFISVDYDKRLEESIGAAGGLSAAEMAGIWELRDKCREAQLRRVISTRAFQKAAVMKQCGDSWREIRDRLLEGWSKDERAKVGA